MLPITSYDSPYAVILGRCLHSYGTLSIGARHKLGSLANCNVVGKAGDLETLVPTSAAELSSRAHCVCTWPSGLLMTLEDHRRPLARSDSALPVTGSERCAVNPKALMRTTPSHTLGDEPSKKLI
ncbi:hypothetical protein BN946_scf184817.g36 [Trametes cinnabarina]|uniref:Uncharacterized protein n=1 Tax=Pycnoporus cinnabarinus TaxID=5643 RepID=A0A060S5L1_PYCCI|nr:hypothetical protein BN946_scf184817.g36 [Trametes cinnabarina]